jgi:hypothetical protein
MKKNDCTNIFASEQILGGKSFYLYGGRGGTQIDVTGALPETTL